MKIYATLAFASALLATPVLAQTTTAPAFPAAPPLGTTTTPSGQVPVNPVAPAPEGTAPDAAAAGNAERTQLSVPNTGSVSGGPSKAAGE